jgi:hypothetical protein
MKRFADNIEFHRNDIMKFTSFINDHPFTEDTIKKLILNSAFGAPKKPITLKSRENSYFIKCDAKDCEFKIPSQENLSLIWLWKNVPCPVCKSNLLIESDYFVILLLNSLMNNPIIKFLEFIGKKLGYKEQQYIVKTDGTGKVIIDKLN